MTELVGDICMPSDFTLPLETTAAANLMSGAALVSGAMIWNIDLQAVEVWTGSQWISLSGMAVR